MSMLFDLLGNYIVTVGVASWVAAQFTKAVIHYFKYREFSKERLFGAGGMPSCHSALMTSVVMSVGKLEGVNSTEFALAIVLALIVMYDAMGVRRAAGEHAKAINKIYGELSEEDELEIQEQEKPLKEYLGHTPLEVLAGALLGIVVAMFIPVL